MTKHTLHFEIDQDAYARLQALAETKGMEVDDMLVAALIQTLEDAEDMASIADYEKRRAAGNTETVSLDQLSKELGLDD
jgi:predicted DNA-binding protein